MLTKRFGIEIELTGITKDTAANAVKEIVGGRLQHTRDSYNTIKINATDGRTWKIMNDSSIRKQSKWGNTEDRAYSVELVSPILTADDIDKVQEIVRALRASGGKTNSTCGIHIHLDGADHNVQSIKNFINII